MEKLKDKIIKTTDAEMKLHPDLKLCDYYKFFYQGQFGPGHLLKDPVSAREYLQKELDSAEIMEEHYIQNIGLNGNFYRVNLIVIKKNLISFEDFFAAFQNSAANHKLPNQKGWCKLWGMIQNFLENDMLLSFSSKEKETIEHVLQSDDMMCHHSEFYRGKYHPHYRLFSKEIVDKLDLF